MEIGLLHELQFFQSFLGLGISIGFQAKIPPIYSLLGHVFGLRTTRDVPAKINFAELDDPLFRPWRVPGMGLLGGWWADADFNMADPYDSRNKTRLIRMEDLFQHMSEFRTLQADILQAHHRSQTEGLANLEDHTSRRSQWRIPRMLFEEDQALTLKEAKLEDWPSLSAIFRGRSWAPVLADADLTAGVHYMGDADFRRNRGEWPMRSASDVAWNRFDSGYQGLYLESIGTDRDITRAPHGFAGDDPITRDLYPWEVINPQIPSSSLVSTNPAEVMEPFRRWLEHPQASEEEADAPAVHNLLQCPSADVTRKDSSSASHVSKSADRQSLKPSVRFASPITKLEPRSNTAIPSDRFSQLALQDSDDDADDEEDEMPLRVAAAPEKPHIEKKAAGGSSDGGISSRPAGPSIASVFAEMAVDSDDDRVEVTSGPFPKAVSATKRGNDAGPPTVASGTAGPLIASVFAEMAADSDDDGVGVKGGSFPKSTSATAKAKGNSSKRENDQGPPAVAAFSMLSEMADDSSDEEMADGERRVDAGASQNPPGHLAEPAPRSAFAEMIDDSDEDVVTTADIGDGGSGSKTSMSLLKDDNDASDEDVNVGIVKSVFAEMMGDESDDEDESAEPAADGAGNVFASMLLDDDNEDMQWDTEAAYPLEAMPDEPEDESEDV
ncbi:hypothetical protein CVT24_002521 [Panaeolus cyanescens]|uniref:Uncharacterized protein n=1 Tax=Panaeolus cyanescens TaxID=181874 RepID=A0A409YTK2_9AGAR|nr:hypothetical protein CVT24_002521 [Panaeolus cyanescens]